MRTFALVTLLGSMLTLVFVFLWMVEGEVPEVVLQPRIPHIEMPDGRAPTTPPDLQSTAPQGIEDTASIVSITRHKELAEKTRLFRGIVVDSRGLPVPGAHVRFSRNGLIAEAEAQSDGRYAALVNDEQLVAEDDNIPSAWELNEIEKHLNAEQRKVFRGKVRAARRKARERPRRMRKRMVDMSAGEVVARCDFDGFISDVQTIEVRSLSDGITEVDFVLLPGSMVKGRVMHSDVRVVGASVYLLDLEYAKLDATRTDEFGEYAFGIENAGLYHILARADGLGAGVLKTQNLSPLWGVDLDELVLIGGGYLKGKVSYPNGDPAHRVNLLVVPETYAHRKQPTVREDELLRLEANGGLAVSRTKTGGDGAFAFSGLADMNFGIRFAPDPHPEAPMVSIHPRGETNIQLHLDSHRLCVIAESWVGYELPGVDPQLYRIERDEHQAVSTFQLSASSVSQYPERIYFFVQPGEEYLARAEGPDLMPVEKIVPVPQGKYETRVRLGLVLREQSEIGEDDKTTKPPKGRIRVEVSGAANVAVPFELTLFQKGAEVSGFTGNVLPTSHEVRSVPLGTYYVKLTPTAAFGHYLLPTLGKEPAVVRDGQLAKVAILPHIGGRLAIRVLPLTTAVENEDGREGIASVPPLHARIKQEDEYHGLLFRHLEGDPASMPGLGALGDPGRAMLTPGEGHWLSDPLPAGVYELSLGGNGYKGQTHRVVVPKGKIGKLTVRPKRD